MNNTYGVVRPSIIDIEQDVSIFYHYRPTRVSQDDAYKSFKKVDDPTSMLKQSELDKEYRLVDTDSGLPGMFDLSLPASIFGKVGIYTVYILPKEIKCTIKDVGALAAYPDVQGIVIDMNTVDGADRALFSNEKLVGYRVEYFGNDGDGLKRQQYYRIITSNNFCEPMSQNLTSANTNSNGYRFNDSATLCFITLTPSTSPSFKASSKPYIGAPNQVIVLSNTKFDPVMVEIEIVKNDDDTLATMISGNQVRALDKGTITTFNDNDEIALQHEVYTVKDNYTSKPVFEVKKKRVDDIDYTISSDLFNV